MSELLSNRPTFTITMGCNGAGKSAWKRMHYDELPSHFVDQDSVAGGFGDWDDARNREDTRALVDREVDSYISKRLDFGMESTFSRRPGVAMMDRVIREGYQVKGIYIGTDDPQINIDRIKYRVDMNLGHRVDPARVPDCYRHSLSNLRRKIDQFDELELIDNSIDDTLNLPSPVLQCVVTKGAIDEQLPRNEMADWCRILLDRIDRAREMNKRREANQRMKEQRRSESNSDD